MRILENKVACIIIMVALMVAGFFIGGTKSLNSIYNEAEKVFLNGEDGDGICIQNDLTERASAAINMVTIGLKYEAVAEETAAVKKAAAELESVSQIDKKSAANKELDRAVAILFSALEGQKLSENDKVYAQKLYNNFNSRNDTISHDPYNKYAVEYNEIIDKFPAKLLPAKEAVIFY